MASPPDRAETERLTRDLGETMTAICPPGIGFALVLFTFEPGWSTYCANAKREDMIRELRDCSDRLEAQAGETLPPMMWAEARAWLKEREARIFIRLEGGGRGCLVDLVGEERAFHVGRLCERLAIGAPVYVLAAEGA